MYAWCAVCVVVCGCVCCVWLCVCCVLGVCGGREGMEMENSAKINKWTKGDIVTGKQIGRAHV